jgi:hypothetical protein
MVEVKSLPTPILVLHAASAISSGIVGIFGYFSLVKKLPQGATQIMSLSVVITFVPSWKSIYQQYHNPCKQVENCTPNRAV